MVGNAGTLRLKRTGRERKMARATERRYRRPAQALIAEQGNGPSGFVFAGPRGRAVRGLDQEMRSICAKLGVERATPHDLRRTFSTTVTGLGFGRDALNRITNHKEGGIASVYDRHGYADENKRIMERVAHHILSLAEGRAADNVSWRWPKVASPTTSVK